MRLHRFYISPSTLLLHDLWLRDDRLLHQWNKVLRMTAGNELVLFNGIDHDRLYRIDILNQKEAHLLHVTDLHRTVPKHDIYLFWSLLKRDKNEWVLQKCTELGVTHFVPLVSERSERTVFNVERAQKIIIEAVEQCGRSDIPAVRDQLKLDTAIREYKDKVQLYVAHLDSFESSQPQINPKTPLGIFVGPEGGWSEAELKLFTLSHVSSLQLGAFTLRAETAAVAAIAKLDSIQGLRN